MTGNVLMAIVVVGLALVSLFLLIGMAYMHAMWEDEKREHARTRALLDGYQRAQERMAARQLALRPEVRPLALGTPDVLEFDPAGIDSIIGGHEGPPLPTRIDKRPEGQR